MFINYLSDNLVSNPKILFGDDNFLFSVVQNFTL